MGCVCLAAARTLVLPRASGGNAGCVSDALHLRRRRGGGSLGFFRRRFARGSRWKFQFATLLRVRPHSWPICARMPEGQEHRSTVDGRLCAAVFVHGHAAYSVPCRA